MQTLFRTPVRILNLMMATCFWYYNGPESALYFPCLGEPESLLSLIFPYQILETAALPWILNYGCELGIDNFD